MSRVKSENLGGLAAVPAGLFERGRNLLTLYIAQRSRRGHGAGTE